MYVELSRYKHLKHAPRGAPYGGRLGAVVLRASYLNNVECACIGNKNLPRRDLFPVPESDPHPFFNPTPTYACSQLPLHSRPTRKSRSAAHRQHCIAILSTISCIAILSTVLWNAIGSRGKIPYVLPESAEAVLLTSWPAACALNHTSRAASTECLIP